VITLEVMKMKGAGQERRPDLLFIHGAFHGAWCWSDHFMPFFAQRGHDCTAISLREHCNSERSANPDQWRLADYVEDVLNAIDPAKPPPILIGHSLGGSIAQKVAAHRAVVGLVLLAPSPIGGSNRAALRMMALHPRAMLGGFLRGNMKAALPAFCSFFFSKDLPEAVRAKHMARLDGNTSFAAAADVFWRDPPRPRPLGVPVLVVSGADDWSIPHYKNERLARAYSGDHLLVPTAHDIMCDTRWEDAACAVSEWIDRRWPLGDTS
jgi:pimeloyl-ACP methyl ester carboxylesterase